MKQSDSNTTHVSQAILVLYALPVATPIIFPELKTGSQYSRFYIANEQIPVNIARGQEWGHTPRPWWMRVGYLRSQSSGGTYVTQ